MIKRIICDFILFAFVFLAPWYWTAGLIAVFIIILSQFWEGVIAALIIDSIYYVPDGEFSSRLGILTLFFLALFYASYAIKNKIRPFA
ncbi:MAG: hypothetical protein AAB890_00120 [Patescibacteria group bacterium]